MTTPTRLFVLFALLAPVAVWAHPDAAHGATFFSGLGHPVTGIDHLLAMIAVGMTAARGPDGRRWVAPACFMAMLFIGVLLGGNGWVAPFNELAIAASVVLFGLVVLARRRLPLIVTGLLLATFALFHGTAHGMEAVGVPGLSYIAGMLLMTGCLHVLGWAMARLVAHRWGEERIRWSGTPITVGGLALLFGTL